MKKLNRAHKIALVGFLIMAVWTTIAMIFEAVTHAPVIVPVPVPGNLVGCAAQWCYLVILWKDYLIVTIPSTGGMLFFAWATYEDG
jgi:hypothetical protein